jgi:hypothetical protein
VKEVATKDIMCKWQEQFANNENKVLKKKNRKKDKW